MHLQQCLLVKLNSSIQCVYSNKKPQEKIAVQFNIHVNLISKFIFLNLKVRQLRKKITFSISAAKNISFLNIEEDKKRNTFREKKFYFKV